MEVVKELVKKNMESALHLSIPLVANVVAGPNLRDLA
jgi:DNA polymerase I-like protein with 3'-5' exonuclease and polymerase domains